MFPFQIENAFAQACILEEEDSVVVLLGLLLRLQVLDEVGLRAINVECIADANL